jgi:hypothetical protein
MGWERTPLSTTALPTTLVPTTRRAPHPQPPLLRTILQVPVAAAAAAVPMPSPHGPARSEHEGAGPLDATKAVEVSQPAT